MCKARARVVRRAVLALVMGAVVSWGVAWWLAVYRPTDGWPNVFKTTAFDWTSKYQVPQYRFATPAGDVFVDWTGGWGYDKVSLGPAWTREMTEENAWLLTTYPYPADLRADVREVHVKEGWNGECTLPAWVERVEAGSSELQLVTSAWGWPMRCLCAEERVAWDRPDPATRRFRREFTSCVVLRQWTDGRVRVLPVRVAWAGFGVNTLVYGAAVFVLVRVMGGVRRGLRRARGVCAACGYSRAGIGAGVACPECGDAPRCNRVRGGAVS